MSGNGIRAGRGGSNRIAARHGMYEAATSLSPLRPNLAPLASRGLSRMALADCRFAWWLLQKPGLSGRLKTIPVMGQRFLSCDREQVLLTPPSLREWLPEDHLAWFVLAAVEGMDLSAFYVAYRDDGHGRPAHDPSMLVALLLYAYAKGQRSSRVIERECVEDIAYRVIAAKPAAGSHDDRAFSPAPRAGAVGAVRRGLGVVCGGGSGVGRAGRDRRHEGARERFASLNP
jgi:hypothetical protein